MIVYPTRGITVTRYIVCNNSEIIIYIMIMPYDIAYTYNIIDHCYLTKSKRAFVRRALLRVSHCQCEIAGRSRSLI